MEPGWIVLLVWIASIPVNYAWSRAIDIFLFKEETEPEQKAGILVNSIIWGPLLSLVLLIITIGVIASSESFGKHLP